MSAYSSESSAAPVVRTTAPIHSVLRLLAGKLTQAIGEGDHEILGKPVCSGIRDAVAGHTPVDVRRLLEDVVC